MVVAYKNTDIFPQFISHCCGSIEKWKIKKIPKQNEKNVKQQKE